MPCAGECIFDFFTPAEIGRHMVLFTYAMTASCFFVFFYMVGAHPLYKLQSEPDAAACMAAAKPRWIFLSWMVRKVCRLPAHAARIDRHAWCTNMNLTAAAGGGVVFQRARLGHGCNVSSRLGCEIRSAHET